jgi:hypothetical protein
MKIMSVFLTILLVQLFYSVGVTMFVYALPADSLQTASMFSDLSSDIDVTDTANEIEASLNRQTSIPLIDIGALVFYSSSIIIDLLLNFVFAIPQMLTLLLNAFGTLFLEQIDTVIMTMVQSFISAVILVWYLIGLLQFFSGVVSGGSSLT